MQQEREPSGREPLIARMTRIEGKRFHAECVKGLSGGVPSGAPRRAEKAGAGERRPHHHPKLLKLRKADANGVLMVQCSALT